MKKKNRTSQPPQTTLPVAIPTVGSMPVWCVMMVTLLLTVLVEVRRLRDELLAKQIKLEASEELLRETSDFLRTTSENSNWPSSVTSVPLLRSAQRILKKINETLGITEQKEQQKKTEGTEKQTAQQPDSAKAENQSDEKTGESDSSQEEKKTTKRPAHHKGTRQKIYPPDNVKDVAHKRCPYCGGKVDRNSWVLYQVLEMVFSISVTHYHVWHCVCHDCGRKLPVEVPPDARFGFGPRLTAFIGFFTGLGVTRRKLAEAIRQMTNVTISQGGIQKCLDRVSASITPQYEAIMKHSRRSFVNYIDETTSRLFGPAGKAKHWLWVMTNRFMTFFMIFEHRSSEAFAHLIGEWAGILVSDGYACYIKWGGIARQSCLAHLIRKAKKLSESTLPTVACGGRWILVELRRLVKMAHNPPSQGEYAAWKARFSRCVLKYKSAEGDLGKLCALLERETAYITTFLRFGGAVEPTNNRAERSLRPMVCRRKVSFGCTSQHGELDIAKLMTLHETCRLNGMSTFDELVRSLQCYARGKKASVYWIRRVGMKAARLDVA